MRRKVFVKTFPNQLLDIVRKTIEEQFSKTLEPEPPTNEHEFARFRSGKDTIVMYKSGKVVINHLGLDNIEELLLELTSENYETFVGIDETGKGELFGGIIVCGAKIKKDVAKEVEKSISTLNTKNKIPFQRYEELIKLLDRLGVEYLISEIPPTSIVYGKTNKLLLDTYLSTLDKLLSNVDFTKKVRVVLDDFGINLEWKKLLINRYQSADVIIEHRADDRYIECKTASLISRYHRELFLNKVNTEYELDGLRPGSGNLSDPNTTKWLERWVAREGNFPPFVKKWNRVINKILKKEEG